ncbi:sperm acrosome membrane-associated protein 4 [Pseudophryne corroboree]|uniref:sperm acrosome membrane-associated protein 4 n=1 Tax=Pseudophryne corroboree TaxID=495146 RepID=UPI00308138DD
MMKGCVITCVLLLLSSHIGHAMECYSCDYGICLFPTKETCGLLQICGTETAKTGNLNLRKKGCLGPTECLTESSVTYMGVTVTTTRSCCVTNLCNSAVTPKVSFITGIAAMLAVLLPKLS